MDFLKIELKRKKQKPDEKNLSFGKNFTDHMFTMDYENGWKKPRIVPHEPFLIDPSAMVFHYGQSVFEGLKAYRGENGKIILFRPLMNFKRMNISAERICIPRFDENFVLNALKELLKVEADWIPRKRNNSLYIRPFVFATDEMVGVRPSEKYKFMIILSPVGAYCETGLKPQKIMVEDEYVRACRGGIGFTKASANYAISLKGQERAVKMGCSQVLWLDGIEQKYVEEVGTMNIFFVINGTVVTPPLTGSILPGVTRDSAIQLLKHWNIPVEERPISIDEVFSAGEKLTEAFGTGTAAVISPIGELIMNEKHIRLSESGEISKKLYDCLTDIQYGRVKDEFNWTLTV